MKTLKLSNVATTVAATVASTQAATVAAPASSGRTHAIYTVKR